MLVGSFVSCKVPFDFLAFCLLPMQRFSEDARLETEKRLEEAELKHREALGVGFLGLNRLVGWFLGVVWFGVSLV